MRSEELSVLLDEYIETEDRDTIRQRIIADNDTLISEASMYSAGVPTGYNNWKDAYNGLRTNYVKNVLNRGKEPEREPEIEPEKPEERTTIKSLFS